MKWWGWAAWWMFLAAWTVALTTTFPVEIHRRYLPDPPGVPLAKVLHVTAYAALAAGVGLLRPRYPWGWLAILLLLEHGVATEYIQSFVPERGPSLSDVLIDHAAVALGAGLTWWRWARR
jgi:VanZ family protein